MFLKFLKRALSTPFTYVVNVYSNMSLSKGHLGSRRGGGFKNKLKDTSFIFPMTNVTILGKFRTHAQKDTVRFWIMKSTYILTFQHFYVFKSRNELTQNQV